MAAIPPNWVNADTPFFDTIGDGLTVPAGQKVVLQTDGASANGAIQFNKDVDGLLFANMGKQDLTVVGNPTANIISLTNDLTGFEPMAVSKVLLCGSATVGTENAASIGGDQTTGIAVSADMSVPSLLVNGTLNGIPPGAIFRATFTGSQSVPNGAFSTGTFVQWDTVVFDFVGTTTAPFEDFVVPQSGYYRLYASANYAANATGVRQVGFRNTTTNTTLDSLASPPSGTSTAGVACEGTFLLQENDSIQVWVAQNSGGALNMTSARWEIQLVRDA